MKIRQAIIPIGKTRSGKPLKGFKGVTIHNTGNHDPGADADANARYLKNNVTTNIAGFHYVVDQNEIVCTIPENEIAEHSGTRQGNDTTVSVEICDNVDGNILLATNLAAQLTADILLRHGQKKAVWEENIFQHNDWSGKNCPEDIRQGNPYNWDAFVRTVNKYMNADAPFIVTKVLKKGMNDAEVIPVVNVLRAQGYTKRNTSIFDKNIEDCVKAYQRAKGLVDDGKVGEKTTQAMGGTWDKK